MDFKTAGKENKKRKRPDLAPLPKRTSPVVVPVDDQEDDFTEEQLAELFGPEESATTNVVSNDMIDLDDWVPPSLKSANKELKSKEAKITNLKSSNLPKEKAATFRSRTDMLFSSIELEPDSVLGLRFQKRKLPASQLKDLAQHAEKVRLVDALKYAEKKEWFTFGVVSDFSEMRQAGGARIDVTDLTAEPYTLKVLLFGAAFKGKIDVGSIVCIKNPKKAKPYNGKQALAVNNADQALVVGTSRDFSLCRGRKKDGGICKNVVNTHICRFCKFHAMTEFKNQKIGKDLQAVSTGAGLSSRIPTSNSWNNKPALKPLTPARKNVAQIKKDQERLDRLSSSSASKQPEKRKFDQITSPKSNPTTPIAKKPCVTVASPEISLPLQKSPTVPGKPERLSAAKRKALEYAKQNGGIVQGKAKKSLQIETTEPAVSSTPVHLSEKFLSMMKEKPRDADLFNDAESAERNKKFSRLEIIEEIGEKLAATHEVPVRAIRCLVCKKNYHQMPLQCVMNKHKCKVVAGTKRFFECNGCRAKTSTLEILPVAECGKCGVWSWKKSGVAKDRVCQAAPQLSVRGFEETFVGSVVKDPNLNLLVPNNE